MATNARSVWVKVEYGGPRKKRFLLPFWEKRGFSAKTPPKIPTFWLWAYKKQLYTDFLIEYIYLIARNTPCTPSTIFYAVS